MPRGARQRSNSGIYHVTTRGVSGSDLFLDDRDHLHYLYTLHKVKAEHNVRLHAYCLMKNHTHLLIEEGEESIGQTMQRINIRYARWINTKYGRNGVLFQGRFYSEAVEDDAYFLTALRYVLQNPVKAQIVDSCGAYRWSSYLAYVGGVELVHGLTDTEFAVKVIGGRERLLQFINVASGDSCLDVEEMPRASDQEIYDRLFELLGSQAAAKLQALASTERREVLRKIKGIEGASMRQIARITQLSKSTIDRA